MPDENNRKPLMIGDFGYEIEYLETEMERAARLEAEEDRRRARLAREAGVMAVESELANQDK